ncbi:MAG: hypothetical protein WA919_08270 [Coleofasciculaceae cyanobacterium]
MPVADIAKHLAQMPGDWLEELHQASIKLNTRQTLKLIEQIPEKNSLLALALANWAYEFRFDKITQLCEQGLV